MLYVSDLDGTLLTKDERVSVYSQRILNDLIAKGLQFTFATARSIVTARLATKGLTYTCPAILYNGAVIKDLATGKLFDVECFSPNQIDFFKDFFRKKNISPFVYAEIDGKEKLSWLKGAETEGMKRYLSRRKNDERLNPVDTYEELFQGEVFYFNCINTWNDLIGANNELYQRCDIRLLFTQETYHTDFWLEIMPKRASKAEALLKLKKIVGADQVVCFGDGVNDIEMFSVADESYAVLNAHEELKKRATAVIGYSEEDSVAKWLSEHYQIEATKE